MNEQERFPIMNTDWKSRQLKDDVPMQWVLNHESQCLTNHGQTARDSKNVEVCPLKNCTLLFMICDTTL